MEIPKYKSKSSEIRPPVQENSNNVASGSDDQAVDKLRADLFSSGWGENSNKGEDNAGKLERQTRDVLVVNYSTGDSSEVEMLDSSTAHIEY
jgi:hypothetical protein